MDTTLGLEIQHLADAVSGVFPRNQESSDGFWRACAQGRLAVPRCDACKTVEWYPREYCSNCLSQTFTWLPVSPLVTVHTRSLVHFPFIEELVPFLPVLTGLVDLRLPEDTDRILRMGFLLPGSCDEEVEIGSTLQTGILTTQHGPVPMFMPQSGRRASAQGSLEDAAGFGYGAPSR